MPQRRSPSSRSRSGSPPRADSSTHSDRRSHKRSLSPRHRRPSDSSPPTRHYRSRSPRRRRSHSRSNDRSQSPRPRRRSHSRSRSPPPRKETKGSTTGGFKWKDKPSSASQAPEPKTLERGYREQQGDQPPRRQRSPARDDLASKFGADYQTRYDRPPPKSNENDVASKFGLATADPKAGGDKQEKKKKKDKKPKGPQPTNEPMIIVTVNDRLGTKAQIACLASDPIKLFKAMVAAKIGREPHEIKLQRQGERPFKDGLTLEDYGVSNGVQLDLEVDTGD